MDTQSTPVHLHAESRGTDGQSIVILHGLLGSSRNWRSVAAELSHTHRVSTLDLRNHGASAHSGPFTLDDMAADVESWLGANPAATPAILVGHSLGGKTAMKLACRRPDLVRALIIVDISSEAASRRWNHVFKSMQGIDMDSLNNRGDAEQRLEADGIQGWAFRKFLSSNLATDEQGRWHWKIGLDALSDSAQELVAEALGPEQRFEGPTLLVRGAKSDFAPEADIAAMRGHFPALRVETIPNAAHNVHIEAAGLFIDTVRAFLAA